MLITFYVPFKGTTQNYRPFISRLLTCIQKDIIPFCDGVTIRSIVVSYIFVLFPWYMYNSTANVYATHSSILYRRIIVLSLTKI